MRRWLPGFVALSAIWGASFALIKVAVEAGVPPLWVALWRCALGAVTLWAILVLRRERVPRDRALWGTPPWSRCSSTPCRSRCSRSARPGSAPSSPG